ncbi:MAG TPA: type I DNA topoisomerase, partial [Acidimicrobiia bacterium]|nr:type I DNA topoisomerase [Acidimicrobiia bacterium]
GEPWARLGVDVDNDFKPVYVVPAEKRHQVRKLKQYLADASELYLATDEDREGESIAWHLLEVLSPSQAVPVRRMVFHEITERAIAEAIDNWRELDRRLVDAQEARRVLDRLVGWEVSEVLWKKVMQGLSAGRVQSVATRLVVARERERMAFRSASFHDLEGVFSARDVDFTATLVEVDGTRLATGRDFDAATGQLRGDTDVVALDEAAADDLRRRLEGADFAVAAVESRDYHQSPYPPFITSTLQQEAGRKLRFSAARTMAVAQRLYERGYITYMRTDSTNLSEQAVAAARTEVRTRYGAEFLPDAPRVYRKKVKSAQEAHEAIRPSGEVFRFPDDVRGEVDTDEFRLYELVWKRTVACQMADARGKRLSIRLSGTTDDDRTTVFAASGKTIEFAGFLRAYVEGADDPDAELEDREVRLPSVEENEAVDCRSIETAAHATQPPARYTEASLVKELESRGIGRPSTYASVLQTIQSRGYVFKKGSALVPSWTAFAVTKLLEGHFDSLVDYDFTARMEEDLDGIARGEIEAAPWLHRFYFGNGQVGLKKLVADHLPEIDAREVNSIPIGADGDGNDVVVRVGRYGPYLQRGEDRASIPEDIAPDELTLERAVELLEKGAGEPTVLGDDPETGLPVSVRHGRFGPYVQLGEATDENPKPPRAGLFRSMDPATLTLDEALALLALPRVVGTAADGTEITAQNGRFGPYIKAGTDTRSLESEEQIFTITEEQARELLAQPKKGRRRGPNVLKELGEHPDSGAPVRVLEGRYGPYVTDGTVNASLPRGRTPEDVEMEEALHLLAERAAKAPAGGRRKKTASRKKGTSKKKASSKKSSSKKGSSKRSGGASSES